MIGVIRLKNVVMHQCMRLEWIIKFAYRLVHHKPVQGPFEEGRKNDRGNKTDGQPKCKTMHVYLV